MLAHLWALSFVLVSLNPIGLLVAMLKHLFLLFLGDGVMLAHLFTFFFGGQKRNKKGYKRWIYTTTV
jgi:hypothetical protein